MDKYLNSRFLPQGFLVHLLNNKTSKINQKKLQGTKLELKSLKSALGVHLKIVV